MLLEAPSAHVRLATTFNLNLLSWFVLKAANCTTEHGKVLFLTLLAVATQANLFDLCKTFFDKQPVKSPLFFSLTSRFQCTFELTQRLEVAVN